jgi:hypothetical protein
MKELDRNHHNRPRHGVYLAWTLAACPLFIYWFYIVWFSADGPFGEEHDLLKFFAAWYDAGSWLEKYHALTIQATDHKPVTSYLSALLIYKLIGHVDFVYLGYIANLTAILILWLTLVQFKQSRHFLSLVVISSLLGFQLTPLGNMFWAGGGLAGNLAILFALLSLIFLCKQSVTSTLLAIVFAALSIYSLGNGMIVLPAALMLVFCTQSDHTTSKGVLNRKLLVRQLIIYEIIGIAIALLFFSQNPPQLSTSIAVTDFDILTFLWITVRLLGGGFSYDNVILQTLFGILIIAMNYGLFALGYHKRRPALAAYMAFLVGTVVVLCLYRNWTLLDPHANITRYYFISMQIWIVLMLCYGDMYLSRLYAYGNKAILASGAILVLSFVFSYCYKTEEVATLCWNKKYYSQSQIIAISQANPALETVYEQILKQSLDRGYFNAERLFSEKAPNILSDKTSCYTALQKPPGL